ncbi:MAG: hypothetical protein ABL921_29255 [Pirellula sp.]
MRGQTEFSSYASAGNMTAGYEFHHQLELTYEIFHDIFGDVQNRGHSGRTNKLERASLVEFGMFLIDDEFLFSEASIKEFPKYHLLPHVPTNQTSSLYKHVEKYVHSHLNYDFPNNKGKISAGASKSHEASPNPALPKELDTIAYVFEFEWKPPNYGNSGQSAGQWDWDVTIGREQPLLGQSGSYSYSAQSGNPSQQPPTIDPPLQGTKLDWIFSYFPSSVPSDLFVWAQGHPDPIQWSFESWSLEYILEGGIV